MERKIGEIFNYQDNWYQCIENTGYGCIICHFNTHNNICCNNVLNIIGNCLPPYRKDYKSVVFRKLLFKGISYPIIALVEDTAKEETIYGYNEKGKVMIEDDATYKDDLMMLPPEVKWEDKCTIGDLLWGLFLVVLSPASLIVIIIVELVDSGFFKKSL